MSPQAKVLLGLAVLTVVVVVVVQSWPDDPTLANSESAADSTEIESNAADQPDLDPEAPGVERRADPVDRTAETTSAADEVAAGKIEVIGRIVAFEPGGGEDADVSRKNTEGLVDLQVSAGEKAWKQSIEVRAGQFRATVPAGSTLAVEQAELDGRVAYSMMQVSWAAEPGEHTLYFRFDPGLVLEVVDAQDGQQLHDLTVSRAEPDRMPYPPPEDRSDLVLKQGVSSPVPMSPWVSTKLRDPKKGPSKEVAWVERVWVCAPGYAWEQVRLDFQERGPPVRVGLQPACSLQVQLEGAPEAGSVLHPRLILRAAERDWPLRRRDLDGPSSFTFERLAPGAYDAVVEYGGRATEKRGVLGSARIELDALDRGELLLRLEAMPEVPVEVPIAGTLSLPPGWGKLVSLDLEILEPAYIEASRHIAAEEMEQLDAQGGSWSWNAGQLPAGRYQLTIPQGWVEEVEVAPPGRTDIALELPEPAQLDVVLRDLDSGEDVSSDCEVWWAPLSPTSGPGRRVSPNDEGVLKILAPPGRILLTSWNDSYRHEKIEREVLAGTHRIEFNLQRECGVVLSYESNEVPLDLPWDDVPVRLSEIEGDGTEYGWSVTHGTQTVFTSNPGTYELIFDSFPGFEPVETRTVEIPPATLVPLEIQLTRSR